MHKLIIGGTGTLGKALLAALGSDRKHTCIFSRDELKQQELKKMYPECTYIIGDIRDKDSIDRVISSLTRHATIYHFAALKHIDVVEENAEEAVKTNFHGLVNAVESAKKHRIAKFVFTSTDKAVEPINVYGMTKGIAERYLLDFRKKCKHTSIYVYRWGNIIASRGSVIPYFASTIKELKTAYVTDVKMTRFWLRIKHAVDFILKGSPAKNYVDYPKDMKAAKVIDIVECIAGFYDVKKCQIIEIGMRPGEKIHEAIGYDCKGNLITSENAPQYSKEELKELIYPFLEALEK